MPQKMLNHTEGCTVLHIALEQRLISTCAFQVVLAPHMYGDSVTGGSVSEKTGSTLWYR